MNCILCKKEIFGFGNNSLSLKNGEFYDECNRNKVLPERLFLTGMNDKQILVVDAENDWLKLENLKGKEVSLKRLQQLVDGYIQLYQKSVPKFFYIVNEKRGGIYEPPENKLANRLLDMQVFGNFFIWLKNCLNKRFDICRIK